MSEQLKPCPFCGRKAIITQRTIHGKGGCDLYSWEVGCTVCGSQFPAVSDKAIRDENGIRLVVDGHAIAIAAWNSRHDEGSDEG